MLGGAALSLATNGWSADGQTLPVAALRMLLVVASVAVFLGMATAWASTALMLCGVAATIALSPVMVDDLAGGGPAAGAARLVAEAAVLWLLGPGAYAVDARRFGRREVLVPGRATPPSH